LSDYLRITPTERYTLRMRAAEADRLLEDRVLWDVFLEIRANAANAAMYGADFRARDDARHLVLAIDTLRRNLEDRIDTAKNLDAVEQRARGFE